MTMTLESATFLLELVVVIDAQGATSIANHDVLMVLDIACAFVSIPSTAAITLEK